MTSSLASPLVAVLAVLVGVIGCAGPVRPEGGQRPPRIAAAANLNVALTEIAGAFEQERGRRVELVFGASGTLTRQILDGAPFELFLAADESFPDRLAEAGLTRDDGSIYALGRLALFAPSGSPLTVDERLDGLAELVRTGDLERFAIANPEVAPYGRAAEAVLRKHGLWDGLRPRLVLGDSVAQAAQFTVTGNASGGLLPYSIVLAPTFAGRGTHALIPSSDHPSLRQKMVLMKGAGPVSVEFHDFVLSDTARAILGRHGYEVPE